MALKYIYSNHLNLQPYKYQKECIDFCLNHHYNILGLEMGLGKTLIAIATSLITRSKTLVICPAFLKYNWEEEYNKFSKKKLKIVIDKFDEDADVIITNYARINSGERYFKWADLVIADEVHYLKNKDAERTKGFHQYLYDHRPSRFIGLSGTPITGKVPDWFSLLLLTSYNPHKTSGLGIDGVDYWQFCRKFCNVKNMKIRGRTIPKFYGLKNPSGLKKLLRGKYIRRLCKDVLDLDDILESTVVVPGESMEQESIDNMDEAKMEGIWVKVKKESAIAKAQYTVSFASNKIDEDGLPLVIFSDHRGPVDVIAAGLKAAKKRVAVITGDTPMDERHKIVKFYEAGRLDTIVGTIGAMSTGLTLVRGNKVIFNDMSANPASNAQAIKRVHRIGQNKLVYAYFMVGNRIDKDITNILRAKIKTMREAM